MFVKLLVVGVNHLEIVVERPGGFPAWRLRATQDVPLKKFVFGS